MTDTPTLLLTLVGRDRPGVTAAVFETLAGFGVEVLDIEQMVIRGRLVLGVLVTAPRSPAKLRGTVQATAAALGMELEMVEGKGDSEQRRGGRAHVTILGQPLQPLAVAAITGRIADTGANIDRIVRMAHYPVTAIEFQVSGADVDQLRAVLAKEAAARLVDVAVQRVGLLRHGHRLVVMDVDSTLVQGEIIDELAQHAGVGDRVAAVTEKAMQGEIDFEQSLRQRVALLDGLDVGVLDEVYEAMQLSPGAHTMVRTLKRLGYQFGIVSGGFRQLTDRLAADLGIDYAAANQLEVVDGRLTGRLVGEVIDRRGKAEALRRFADDSRITLDRTVAIGDGANDLDMLAAAGLGIAFNAKPAVQQAAQTAVNVPYLDAVLYLLGISREDIEAADAEHGWTTPRPRVPRPH
ncbi:MAG: Phosphoserine phosphatase [uncultured Nocardioidaceae bacterium]|uniref:phosphoserine phosphatase n=1 Tax=uncultured Nocardioidaceae bacterium TaxID=253824 RepID=A0A6J4MVI3_9ACTN|nr:MAG: Phosphoserine phosphatase [uncultured Nocardioidaceae bacterium]